MTQLSKIVVESRLTQTVSASLSSIYDLLVTKPLRNLYFSGPVWKNQRPEEICFQMTGVSANHWLATEDNMMTCLMELERGFKTWDTTVITSLYFFVMIMVIGRVVCCCTFPSMPGRGQRLMTPEEFREIVREQLRKNSGG